MNVDRGDPEQRQMKTGVYKVQDINCRICGEKVGWVYVEADSDKERYKEGKFILEVKAMYMMEPV